MEKIMSDFERPRPTFPKRAVVTGGMPYGNKHLHFGHVAMMLRADTIARFLRDRIGKDNVVFVSGTDCFGSTATEGFRKAKEAGQLPKEMTLQEFIYSNHLHQKETFKMLEIEHNLFGASAFEPMKSIHEEMSKLFISTLHSNGMISKHASFQFYDPKLKVLLNGRQVVGRCPIEGCQSEKGYADECDLGHQYLPMDLIDPVSALTGETPELKRVENWYFDLDKCTNEMRIWLEDIEKRSDTPIFMTREIKEFLKEPEIYVKKEYLPKLKTLTLPKYELIEKNGPSATMVFEKLSDREKACEILAENQIHYRTGKTLVPFRLTGNDPWGVPCPVIEGLDGQTFYVWPESLWAPISLTKAYLKSIGKSDNEWEKFWKSDDAEIYQIIGEDNLSFYGPAQQAMWLHMQKGKVCYPPKDGDFKLSRIVPIKHLLFLNKKASSSGAVKPPMGRDFLNYYTPEQLRMHFLGMNLSNNNVNFMPKPLNPDAKPEEVDPVLKEGNLLTNVYNRILRTFFYSTQKYFDGKVPGAEPSQEIMEKCKKACLDYERFMYDKKLHQVINVVDVFVRDINKMWVKEVNENDKERLETLTANTLQLIKTANLLLHPMAPSGTENVADFLNFDKEKAFSWDYAFEAFKTIKTKPEIKFLAEKQDFFKKHPSQLVSE